MFCVLVPRGQGADSDIIINEIMYHPVHSQPNLQYIELFNRGDTEVDLSNWAFIKGIKFVFPAGTRMAAGAYLVVCRNRAEFTAKYGGEMLALGDFSGQLSHHGEKIELANGQPKVIDAVKYLDHEPWPMGAAGRSPSLERICSHAASDAPENWASSKYGSARYPGGTPGRQNDSYSTHLPPAVSNVSFAPPAPRPEEPVTVSAAITDAEGVKRANLLYRVVRAGTSSEETTVEMRRIARDEQHGNYETIIPGQPQGALVRFRIEAVDTAGAQRLQPAGSEPRPSYSFCSFANTNTAAIPFGFVFQTGKWERAAQPRMGRPEPARTPAGPTRGNGAFLYAPAGGGAVETFDHVRIVPRKAGFKVHFQADHPLKGMTGINILFEQTPRQVLSEPLSYDLYRLAGVPAPYSEHLRIWMDGRLLGYHELIEQPNKSFLFQHWKDDGGNLYKLLWDGHGVIGKHEKKTTLATGHEDLIRLVNGLKRTSGAEQWEFIGQNFNVEEVINYFAVNMCIQNWDGFFNNYFAYHVPGQAGKWEMIPWDEDKTWGDYDGASPRYDWYALPLSFGMNGDRSPTDLFGRSGRGPFGGASWWRPAGYFSGPLLANAEFRQRFLARLREVCTSVFTEETLLPIIAAMEKRLAAEIPIRAQARGEDAASALRTFHSDIQSFRNQVQNRRKFILSELDKVKS